MGDVYYKAVNLTTGEIVADKVRIAQDFKSRSIGLLNRKSLDENEALLIKPCNSIHTFFMKFPIDVVFLDKKGKVVKIKESMQPWRLLSSMPRGFMVLELKSRKIQKIRIKVGDLIEIH